MKKITIEIDDTFAEILSEIIKQTDTTEQDVLSTFINIGGYLCAKVTLGEKVFIEDKEGNVVILKSRPGYLFGMEYLTNTEPELN